MEPRPGRTPIETGLRTSATLIADLKELDKVLGGQLLKVTLDGDKEVILLDFFKSGPYRSVKFAGVHPDSGPFFMKKDQRGVWSEKSVDVGTMDTWFKFLGDAVARRFSEVIYGRELKDVLTEIAEFAKQLPRVDLITAVYLS